MQAQFRERLVAILAGYFSKRALQYLTIYHYNKLTYTDDTKTDYRSVQDIKTIQMEIDKASLLLSQEIIEEAEANGLDISKDEKEVYAQLTKTLNDAIITQKIRDRMDGLIGGLP